jgi:hypothetical protein
VTAPAPAVGTLARLKLTEPVRLYLWPVAALLITGSVICSALGEWLGSAMLAVCGLLVLLAVEAARLSVYSPRAVVQAAMRARGQ